MKEATGELSMTAIVVVILGIVAVAAPVIINTVTKSLSMKTACQASFGCDTKTCDNQSTTTCFYVPDDPEKAVGADQDDGSFKITCSCSDLGY